MLIEEWYWACLSAGGQWLAGLYPVILKFPIIVTLRLIFVNHNVNSCHGSHNFDDVIKNKKSLPKDSIWYSDW